MSLPKKLERHRRQVQQATLIAVSQRLRQESAGAKGKDGCEVLVAMADELETLAIGKEKRDGT